MMDEGAILRTIREDAGLSLGALAKRVYFHKSYLCNIEKGKRRVTPALVRSYLDVFGDDVNRRQVLLALLAGTTGAASADVLGHAFDVALEAPPLTVEEWHARVEDYGNEYTLSPEPTDLQARLARDLTQLQRHLDSPVLAVVAARLLTLYGLVMQSIALPPAHRWFLLGVRAADRSGETATRVWARGRAALSLAYNGDEADLMSSLARDAIAMSDRPSPGRLCAELSLLRPEEAIRTFEALGDGGLSDFAFSEWRVAHVVSRLASRLGDEPLAAQAQDTARHALPRSIPWPTTSLELQRALLMVRCGDERGGVDHARRVLDGMAAHEYRPSVQRLIQEIEAVA